MQNVRDTVKNLLFGARSYIFWRLKAISKILSPKMPNFTNLWVKVFLKLRSDAKIRETARQN